MRQMCTNCSVNYAYQDGLCTGCAQAATTTTIRQERPIVTDAIPESPLDEVISDTDTIYGLLGRLLGNICLVREAMHEQPAETDASAADQPPEADTPDIERIARVCHEINRQYCQCVGHACDLPWEETNEAQRTCVRGGVAYALAHPEATPEDAHNNWYRAKVAAGWTRGPIKCDEAKTHPCLVAHRELPEAQRVKDYLFLGIVRAFAG